MATVPALDELELREAWREAVTDNVVPFVVMGEWANGTVQGKFGDPKRVDGNDCSKPSARSFSSQVLPFQSCAWSLVGEVWSPIVDQKGLTQSLPGHAGTVQPSCGPIFSIWLDRDGLARCSDDVDG